MNNHETLKALYQLDVDEVGEEEAAKRWEIRASDDWVRLSPPLNWLGRNYRRKPGIPWPILTLHTSPEPLPQTWPADAPEWANYMATDENGGAYFYEGMPFLDKVAPTRWIKPAGNCEEVCTHTNWRDTLIERPKPVKQKIEWSKKSKIVSRLWHPSALDVKNGAAFPSDWIAWNCDEHTRGNPLPDGLMVECFGLLKDTHYTTNSRDVIWSHVTRFRIVGIQEGWE